MRTPAILTIAMMAACGGASEIQVTAPVDLVAEERAIAAVLDDWHDAAASADEDRYFGHFALDGVFLGTDATERWELGAFRTFAHPHFERGQAWSFQASRRAIVVTGNGSIAWFDEDLETENLGPVRGSGVLRKNERGRWMIVQYVLSLTIPNERFRRVRDVLSEDDPPPEDE